MYDVPTSFTHVFDIHMLHPEQSIRREYFKINRKLFTLPERLFVFAPGVLLFVQSGFNEPTTTTSTTTTSTTSEVYYGDDGGSCCV